jgi:hypothetical protein
MGIVACRWKRTIDYRVHGVGVGVNDDDVVTGISKLLYHRWNHIDEMHLSW